MITPKAGVKLEELNPRALLTLIACDRVFGRLGFNTVVTSTCTDYDGHMEHSGHYRNDDFDLRARLSHLKTAENQQKILRNLKRAVPAGWYVLLHGEGNSIHYHIGYKPRFKDVTA